MLNDIYYSVVKGKKEATMFDLGLPELIIILIILLLLFGTTRLPKLSRALGEAAQELRKGFSGDPHADSKKSSGSSSNDNTSKS